MRLLYFLRTAFSFMNFILSFYYPKHSILSCCLSGCRSHRNQMDISSQFYTVWQMVTAINGIASVGISVPNFEKFICNFRFQISD
jgi:hypothetical protein